MKQSISDFSLNAAPGKITGEISTQIKEQILDVFDKDSDGVTSEVAALPSLILLQQNASRNFRPILGY